MRRVLLASLLVLVAAGCKGRTELMFGFATDLKAKGQIDRVDFKVFNAPSQVIEISQGWDLADVPAGLYELPGSFGVFTDDGSEPQLQVDFVGSLGGQEILKREAILSPVAGKTLFMRLTLVSECDEATGVHCPGGQSCVEGVCRAPLVNNQTLLPYTKGMENEFACDSGTQFVLSSTGAVIPPKGACGADQFCQEGTCYANPPGATQAIGVSDWTPRPVDVSTTVHSVFTTPGGDVFGVGEHGIILHAPPGSSTVSDETFDPGHALWGVWGTSANDLWAVGAGGVVLHRSAAGWATDTTLPSAARLSSIWGTADGELWAVGRKADGSAALVHRLGGNWLSDATIHAPGELSAIWGSSRNDVWAVGAGFEILRFDGSSWRAGPAAPAGVTADLLAVGGSGQGDVYFVGRGGSVGHLGSDGQIAMQPAGMTSDLYAVWASGPGDVYTVGDYGTILHSAGDGTWTVQESGTREPLFAVTGTGPGNVFAAGRVGTLLHFGSGGGGTPPDMAPPGACTVGGDCGTSCVSGMLTTRGCDQGQCSDLPAVSCAGGYQCANANACATTCAGDADCQADYYCDNAGACQARKAQGSACNADAGGECKGADCHICRDGFFCTDHVCCDKPAAQCGGCQHCSAPSGTCGPVVSGDDPHNFCPASTDECQAATCNGTGSCAKPNATACGTDMCTGTSLTKHTCQSGVCTASAATTCAGGTNCASDGKTCVGKCAQDSDCAQTGVGAWCDKNGDCQPRKAAAGTCNVATGGDCKVTGCGECQSGLSCADGFCCNQACGGQCEACDVAGKIGACSPVPAGTQPHHGAACAGAGTPTCGGYCDGTTRTGCFVPPATTKVTKKTCTSRDVLGGATFCTGTGGVGMAGAAASCDPYACQASGSSSTDDSCLAKCGTVAQCANDNLACENTRCGLPDGSGCKQAAPGDCASTFCAIATAGPTCCSTACNTCTVDGNFTNHLPDCTGGRCAVGTATCGQFLCDKNAQCLKSCHCPIDPTTGKPMTNCRADGSSADAAPECVSGTYCSPMFTPTYVCHLG